MSRAKKLRQAQRAAGVESKFDRKRRLEAEAEQARIDAAAKRAAARAAMTPEELEREREEKKRSAAKVAGMLGMISAMAGNLPVPLGDAHRITRRDRSKFHN